MSDPSLQQNKINFESALLFTTPVKLLAKLSGLHVLKCIIFCLISHLDQLTPFDHPLLHSTSRILY